MGTVSAHGLRKSFGAHEVLRGIDLQVLSLNGPMAHSFAADEAIAEAARKAIIVKSGNMSLGVNLLAALVKRVAAVTSLEGFTQTVSGARGVAERWDAARGLGR